MFSFDYEKNSKGLKIIKEVLFICCILVIVVTYMSLYSHNPSDINFEGDVSSYNRITNYMGIIGAKISSLLFESLGFCAYLLPLMFGYIAYIVLIRPVDFKNVDTYTFIIRVIGFNLLLISTCVLVSKVNFVSKDGVAGGHLGCLAYDIISTYAGYDGTILIMVFMFLIGIPCLLSLSPVTICMFVGNVIISIFNFRKTIFSIIQSFKKKEGEAEVKEQKVIKTNSSNSTVPYSSDFSIKIEDREDKGNVTAEEFQLSKGNEKPTPSVKSADNSNNGPYIDFSNLEQKDSNTSTPKVALKAMPTMQNIASQKTVLKGADLDDDFFEPINKTEVQNTPNNTTNSNGFSKPLNQGGTVNTSVQPSVSTSSSPVVKNAEKANTAPASTVAATITKSAPAPTVAATVTNAATQTAIQPSQNSSTNFSAPVENNPHAQKGPSTIFYKTDPKDKEPQVKIHCNVNDVINNNVNDDNVEEFNANSNNLGGLNSDDSNTNNSLSLNSNNDYVHLNQYDDSSLNIINAEVVDKNDNNSSNIIDFRFGVDKKSNDEIELPLGFVEVADSLDSTMGNLMSRDNNQASQNYSDNVVSSDVIDKPSSLSIASNYEEDDEDDDEDSMSLFSNLGEKKRLVSLDDLISDNSSNGSYNGNHDLPTFPSTKIFVEPKQQHAISQQEIDEMIERLDNCLSQFKLNAKVAEKEEIDAYGNKTVRKAYRTGPVITRFFLELGPNAKSSKIENYAQDIARNLMLENIRVIPTVKNTPYVAIEIPNKNRSTIYMRDLLESKEFNERNDALSICLGRDITNKPVIYDLAKAPHLLVAGTTGSGKSVGINTMIVSLLMKNTPEQLRLILIDPKMLEFSVYRDIPHLLTPIITDMKQVSSALRWACVEMDRRYKLMSLINVRNIDGYNEFILDKQKDGIYLKDPLWRPSDSLDNEAPALGMMSRIVIIVDEFADLMLQMKKQGDIEGMISRLAAKARACGIYLILATQSPRAEVITGTIRSNFPSQISFKVKSGMESRIVIDETGAENLLGRGDMLIKYNDGTNQTLRAHGAFISDGEVNEFADAWRARGKPNYVSEVINTELTEETAMPGERVQASNSTDELYDQIVEYCRQLKRSDKKYSISLIQRKFGIGYGRSARIADMLEENGIVSAPMGAQGAREILID